MDYERPDEHHQSADAAQQPGDRQSGQTAGDRREDPENVSPDKALVVVKGEALDDPQSNGSTKESAPKESAPKEATILVRGEAVSDQDVKPQSKQGQPKDKDKDSKGSDADPKDKEKSPPKQVSEAKVKMQKNLPALDDDGDVGAAKDQVVTRDGKADLAFTGTLIAAAAPSSAPKGKWQEYRIYETNGGKHVFSKITRSIYAEEQDAHEAEVFDPSPSSMPSQLLRSARDLTRAKPMTWSDAAVGFFGYDPLAKELYQKVGGQFEEHIS